MKSSDFLVPFCAVAAVCLFGAMAQSNLLQGDGHCSFAPDGHWIVTDRNIAATREKLLIIFHTGMKQGLLLGTFQMKEYLSGDLRCDLHPRWNRTGDAICFDALENSKWTRQLHVAYLDFK